MLQFLLLDRIPKETINEVDWMILVTGGTGFIGRVLIQSLISSGHEVRTLLRPSPVSPKLPPGLSLDVALSSLLDSRGVRAALMGADTVIHLAGSERYGFQTNLLENDVIGTEVLAEAAAEARVNRFIFLSHIGASHSSAYPLLRAKARSEEMIARANLPFTILRSGLVYGADDHFTTSLAMMLSIFPFFFPIPGDGMTQIHPLALEDLVTAIIWTMDDPATAKQRYEIGGPEYLTFREVVELVMEKTRYRRILFQVRPPFLRIGAWVLERVFRIPPINTFWLDYLAVNRTADLETLPRVFGLHPLRMKDSISYLEHERWMGRFFSFKRQQQRR
jgi:NADH dehydrogenase